MDNNILQMLSGLLNKNGGNGSSPNFSQTQSQPPLYPVEAYSQSQNSAAQNNYSQQSSSPLGENSNTLLPLLLSLIGQSGGSNIEALSKLLQPQNGGANSDIASLASLFSSLNQKKDKTKKDEGQTSSFSQNQEGTLPTNDLL